MTPARPPDDASPLARLLAGGRHNRLAIIGEPPAGLAIGETAHFERVARLLRREQSAACFAGRTTAVADPLRLPFVEALFDRLLVTSPLPASTAGAELRELWRIMSPAALAVFVVKARRPWQLAAPGWLEDDLRTITDDAMFEVLDWQIETIPDRHHIILAGKRDGLRAAPIGAVEATQLATA
jgi:hypothetical protein